LPNVILILSGHATGPSYLPRHNDHISNGREGYYLIFPPWNYSQSPSFVLTSSHIFIPQLTVTQTQNSLTLTDTSIFTPIQTKG